MQIKKKAWLSIYPSKQKEVEIPDMNGEVEIVKSKIEEKERNSQIRRLEEKSGHRHIWNKKQDRQQHSGFFPFHS